MSKKQLNASELGDFIYQSRRLKRSHLIAIGTLLLSLGLILNLNLNERVLVLVKSTLASSSPCTVIAKDIKLSLFPLPKIQFIAPSIPALCFKQAGNDLELNQLEVAVTGPSFFPLGIKANIFIKGKESNLPVEARVGPSEIIIRTVKSKIDTKMLGPLLGVNGIKGSLELSFLFNIEKGKVNQGNLLLESKDLSVSKQKMGGLLIPHMDIGQLLLKLSIKDGSLLNLQEVILGSSRSPLQTTLNGTVKLDQFNPSFSPLDLKGEVKFTKDFVDNFPILDLFISGKAPNQSGFFPFIVRGTVENPTPAFL